MKPKVGQWLFCWKKPGTTAKEYGLRIHDILPNGVYVVEVEPNVYELAENLDEYDHEPHCTGWDWVVPEPQPAEDPDDWVIQDRVPVRPGIDQVCWNEKLFDAQSPFGFIETCCGSQSDGKMHGYGADGWYLSARCRRRDLPKVEQKKTTDDFGMYLESVIAKDPQLKAEVESAEQELAAIDARLNKSNPQPQKTRVRLWIEGPTKMVMCRDKAPYGDWQELHYDSEGFYVEGGQP